MFFFPIIAGAPKTGELDTCHLKKRLPRDLQRLVIDNGEISLADHRYIADLYYILKSTGEISHLGEMKHCSAGDFNAIRVQTK